MFVAQQDFVGGTQAAFPKFRSVRRVHAVDTAVVGAEIEPSACERRGTADRSAGVDAPEGLSGYGVQRRHLSVDGGAEIDAALGNGGVVRVIEVTPAVFLRRVRTRPFWEDVST